MSKMRFVLARSSVLVACLGASAPGCLPDDTRPPPASVVVNVMAARSLIEGIPASSTADGWSIAFDRFLLSIGHASLDGDACTTYSEDHYGRILDMRRPEPQRVGIVYGLGQCDFGFRVSNPSGDSLLGNGVTEQDKTRMRTPGPDAYANMRGISLELAGRAVRGGVIKTFAWSFRQRIFYRECAAGPDAGGARGLALHGNEAVAVNIVVDGEALFQVGLDAATAKLYFDHFAEADDQYGDKDGAVTLDELASVPLADIASMAESIDAGVGTNTWKTLEDYVYLGLVPRLARFQGDGTCTLGVGDRRRGGD